MAKDPACLFYWENWSGGVSTFTRHMKGCYMDLLNAQFNEGPLTLDQVKTVLGSDFGQHWPALQKKFKTTPDGHFFSERLEKEILSRRRFVESRRKNLEGKPPDHMDNHMGIGVGIGVRNGSKGKRGAGEKPKAKISAAPDAATVDAMHLDWEKWGNDVVDGLDHLWDVFGRRKVTRLEMDAFLSVAVRNSWVMESQMSFRYALRGFDAKTGTTRKGTKLTEMKNL